MIPVDILGRAEAEVTIAAPAEGIRVNGRNGLTVHADTALATAAGSHFDCTLLPRGSGVARLRADSRVSAWMRRRDECNRRTAAFCAAPAVLRDARVLGGRRHSAHFSVATELSDALRYGRAVVDGHIFTSRGAGTALDLGLMLVEKLFPSDNALDIERSVCA